MNTLPGEITAITTEQNISLVKSCRGQLFYSLILRYPDTSPWLKNGGPVAPLQRNEVMIALPPAPAPLPALTPPATPNAFNRQSALTPHPLQISVRNQLPCQVTAITSGAILCELTLPNTSPSETQAGAYPKCLCRPANSISNHHYPRRLRRPCLKEIPRIALIKTNEVSLGP